ncbi:hypothetical protein FisN_15Hh163 [Fistulifera solaris]|jgi:hypothetical protein|uniref:Mitochondrial pyruvate carrier n=1 Tax=Fistulifera solaris TaxID=1519565 RepID=A0A1Z5JF94_FISSO|nr:hypothetical protein FisN_15Hh163 [Fistulifera solaris]|eukprot:GAX12687.1 hypothetical protein FisN_15Hh163 [Fistulifera solaris]
MFSVASRKLAAAAFTRSRTTVRRLAEKVEPLQKEVAKEAATKKSWWSSPEWWGVAGGIAGWGISGSAIWDAYHQGPEVISLTMTPVLIVYSTLFAVWSYTIVPKNFLLMSCHLANIGAQVNQLRRSIEYKLENGEQDQVNDMAQKAAVGGAVLAGAVLGAPMIRKSLLDMNAGIVSSVAAAPAGPFTVHFWAPMSKWLISGASFLELDRPTEKISLAQYSALTVTGLFFSRYSLLIVPINYNLSAVNVALFVSSAWHLGRKIKADFIDGGAKKED